MTYRSVEFEFLAIALVLMYSVFRSHDTLGVGAADTDADGVCPLVYAAGRSETRNASLGSKSGRL